MAAQVDATSPPSGEVVPRPVTTTRFMDVAPQGVVGEAGAIPTSVVLA
jgi:hypothetical protein